MYLKKIKLLNFKNYQEAAFDFSANINCFIGDNGVGKTNMLDAIYYLSFCKSYFNPIDSQNIRHRSDYFSIYGTYQKNKKTTDEAACIQKRNQKKKFLLNSKEYSRLADHIGVFPLVMISPYDRDLINEGSDTRRKYIDSVISQFDKLYLDNLINYNKALQQRNILLKKFAERNQYDKASLEIWDEQIIRLGQKIYEVRKAFIGEFTTLFTSYFNIVSAGREETSIVYESQLHTRPLSELLAVSIDRDRAVQYTTTGIHKDDLIFSIDRYPIKKFGSQGQQKSYVIAIKLAQFEYTRNVKGYKPILLLDDIFDKLDPGRVRQIIELVNDHSFGQVFITDTQQSRIEEILEEVDTDHKLFLISNGKTKILPN